MQSESIPYLLRLTIGYGHPKQRLGFLRRLHLVGIRRFAGVIVSPEPDHFLWELRRPLARIVRALAETEVKVIALHFQRIGETDVGQRPAAVLFQLQVLGTILKPNAQITVRFVQDFFGKILTAIRNRGIFFPLDAREAPDPGDDATKLIGHLPRRIEGANPAGRKARNRAAVSVLANIVFSFDLCEHFTVQKPDLAIAHGVVQRAAHGILKRPLPLVRIFFH